MYQFLGYFNIVNFFADNYQAYLVIFYSLVMLVVLVIIDIIYVSYVFSKNKIGAVWPLQLLRSVVSFIVTSLFMPIVEYFVAILECSKIDRDGNVLPKSMNTNIDNLPCWEGSHIIHATVSFVISIVFILICAVVLTIFYEQKTSVHKTDAKTNSTADIFTLGVKVCHIMMYSFMIYNPSLHWIVVIFTFILALAQFYVYWSERPFYDEKMMKIFLIYTGIYLWAATCLLIAKIFESSEFDGPIQLFFIGIPIVVTIVLTEKNGLFTLLLTNLSKFEKGETVIKQVRYFLELCDKKEIDRKSKLLLKGYIEYHVETCGLVDCPLKKYLAEGSKSESVAFLYHHAQTMYQMAISKFPFCTSLRVNYSYFLMERMSNNRQALLELKNAEKYGPSFEEQFIIYRFNKLISEQGGGGEEAEEGELDMVSAMAYKNYFAEFKASIIKATGLYQDFWSLLQNSANSEDTDEALEKMNEFGTKINETNEIITSNFEKMQKLKLNDVEVYQLYYIYVGDILNDKTTAAIYKLRIEELADSNKDADENQKNKLELGMIPNNDDFQYIILGAASENVGTITKISTGVCTLFGYERVDLLGKKIEFIMPEQYQKGHFSILKEKISDFKKLVASNLYSEDQQIKNLYKPTVKDLFVFGKNKSRYLVPLHMKVVLMSSYDGSELFFTARISQNEPITSGTLGTVTTGQTEVCYLITSTKLIIENFTANAINMLGVNSNSQGNMDITKSIKDFSADFIQLEQDDKTPEQIFAGKRQILSNNYKTPTRVFWRTLILEQTVEDTLAEDNSINPLTSKKSFKKSNVSSGFVSSGVLNKTPIMRNKFKEEAFLLSSSEILLDGQVEGFVFRFEKIDTPKKNPTNRRESERRDRHSSTPFVNQAFLPSSNTETGSFINNLAHNSSTGSVYLSNIEKDGMPKIDKNFIPLASNQFFIDPKAKTFIANTPDPDKIKDYTKAIAEKKFQEYKALEALLNQSPRVTSEYSGSDYTYTYTSQEDSKEIENPENRQNEENNSPEIKQEEVQEPETKNSVVDGKNDYYHVKMNDIEFLIYNYKREKIVEIKDCNRESQVEFKITEDYKEDQKIREYKKKMDIKREQHKSEGTVMIEETSTNMNLQLTIKQIEYSLSRKEMQPEVVRMKWNSIIVFALLIIVTTVFLVFFLNDQNEFYELLILIVNSYKLIANSIMGLFYTRELVLLNNMKFTNFILPDRVSSINNMTQCLVNIFSDSYSLQSWILTSTLAIVTENDLNKQPITLDVIMDTLNTQNVELTFNSAFLEAITSLYHIGNADIKNIIPTDKYVYFYMHNSLNNLLITSQDNVKTYMDKINTRFLIKQDDFKILFIVISILSFLFFVSMKFTHDQVIQRKASYMAVFFELENDVITRAIDRCEKFSKKIASEDQQDKDTSVDEDQPVQITEEKESENDAKEETGTGVIEKKKRKQNNSESSKVALQVGFMLSLVFIYYLLITLFYFSYITEYYGYLTVYNSTATEQGYFLLAHNILREYFFDINSNIYNKQVETVLLENLDKNYRIKQITQDTFDIYYETLPSSFQEVYNNIQTNDICYLAGDLFSKNLINKGITCGSFVQNSTTYGLKILLTNYIEEIRYSKYIYDLFIKNRKMKYDKFYNNTLYKSVFYNESEIPTNDVFIENDPFYVFNDQLVRNLGYINVYMIKPSYETILDTFNTGIISYLDLYKLVYICCFIFFYLMSFYFYFTKWRPYEDYLNQTVIFYIIYIYF